MPEKLTLIVADDKQMYESETVQDLPRPHSSSDLDRRQSEDSGVGSPLLVARRSPGVAIAMKRSGSDSLQQTRPRSEDGNSFSISEQTQLLLRKMLVLEKKVNSMESQLKEEQLQRLHLEAKVVKLEEENEGLKQNRGLAHKQLQDFADRFYAATENIRLGSVSPSHSGGLDARMSSLRGSRTPSRRDSVSSAGSIYSRDSVGSRFSGISVSSQS